MELICLFEHCTENLMDFIENIIHKMNLYIDGFKNHVPHAISENSFLENMEQCDIDFWMFLLVESDEILRNKVIRTLYETIYYIQRKHQYLVDVINSSNSENYHISMEFYNKVFRDIMKLRFEDFKLTEHDIETAYKMDNIDQTIQNEEGLDHYPEYITKDKCEIKRLVSSLFKELEKSIIYIHAVSTSSENSAKSCILIKNLLIILVKVYMILSNIYIEK